MVGVAPGHLDEAGLAGGRGGGADGMDQREVFGGEPLPHDLGDDGAGTAAEVAGGVGQLGGAEVVGAGVDEIAGERHRVGDAHDVGAVDAGRQHEAAGGAAVGAIAGEAIGAKREGERGKGGIGETGAEAVGAGGQRAGQLAGKQRGRPLAVAEAEEDGGDGAIGTGDDDDLAGGGGEAGGVEPGRGGTGKRGAGFGKAGGGDGVDDDGGGAIGGGKERIGQGHWPPAGRHRRSGTAGNPPLREPFNHALGLTEYCFAGATVPRSTAAMTVLPSSSLRQTSFRRRLLYGAVLVPVVALALAGCAKPKDATDPTTTGAIATPTTPAEYETAVTTLGDRYKADPKNKDVAIAFASALVHTGRTDQAVAVLQKATIYNPDDREVMAAYGKALASAGQLDMALATIQRAITPDNPDWKLLSAEAAILDQLGRAQEARQIYQQALQIAPNEPSILSNYAMSYALAGDLKQAEKMLRQAIAQPGADSRVRQNLALVVGLQGRFDEAEKIASQELSPAQAAANVAYLKAMLGQQNTWDKLKAKNGQG